MTDRVYEYCAHFSVAGSGCRRFEGIALIEGAGHWVQQEQPEAVCAHLLAFLELHRAA